MKIFNAEQTADLLPIEALINSLRTAAMEYADGKIVSPERMVIPLKDGGVMLSMPATSDEIAIHKLVNVAPGNVHQGLPTIHGQVVCCDVKTGMMLFQVDGPTLTAKRTAAMTMLAIETFLDGPPKNILIIGDGKQAGGHVEALARVYPDADIAIRGYSIESTQAFVRRMKCVARRLAVATGEDADVVITLTTSKTPVYQDSPIVGRLVIGVGAFTPEAAEIHPSVIHGSSLYVDDPAGALHEAGDYIQAGVDWNHVGSIAAALKTPPDFSKPIVFKSVGTGAWDLAACRVIKSRLGN